MDEKTLIEHTIAAFAGCLIAFLIVGTITVLLLFGAVDETVEALKDMAIHELSSMSIECNEAYTAASIVLTLNGVPQYCTISKRPNYDSFVLEIE